MSFKGTFLFLALVAGAPYVLLASGVALKDYTLLWKGSFSSGVIERCDYRVESRGTINRQGKVSGGLRRAYAPVATVSENIGATGSFLFGRDWCEKRIGKNVLVLSNDENHRIFSFSQFLAPLVGIILLALSGLLLLIAYNFNRYRNLYKQAEVISTFGVLVSVVLIFCEYFF